MSRFKYILCTYLKLNLQDKLWTFHLSCLAIIMHLPFQNQKCTRLNDTPPRRPSITKLAPQEASLKYVKNYPTIYGENAT